MPKFHLHLYQLAIGQRECN